MESQDTHASLFRGFWRGSLEDAKFLVLLALLLAITFITQVDWHSHPAEDAAILIRYARHVAMGHGVVWNVGEEPVDGATDFLFMVLIAALDSIGIPTLSAVRFVTGAVHVITTAVVFMFGRRYLSSGAVTSFVSAAFLACGPGVKYVEAYFGTPFFALFVAVSWCLSFLVASKSTAASLEVAFLLSGFITGLVRPEGVVFFALLLAAVLIRRGFRASRRLLVLTSIIFGIAGGAFLLWRLHYFGQLLPNPFYKKGGGHLHFGALLSSIANLLRMSLPFVLVPIGVAIATFVSCMTGCRLGILSGFERAFRETKCLEFDELSRMVCYYLTPIVGFAGVWVLLSDEANYFGRFQYPLIPVILMSWEPLGRLAVDQFGVKFTVARPPAGARWVIAVSVIVALMSYQYRNNGFQHNWRDGRYDVAKLLEPYEGKGYTMAVSEAGLLPLISGWKAIDAWGLNDKKIARQGVIDATYLDEFKPELLMFHAYTSPLAPSVEGRDDWSRMTNNLRTFAEKNNYFLTAVFGVSIYDAHYYYVRRNFPDSAEIAESIRRTPYYWYGGPLCTNFAEVGRGSR